MFYSQRSPVFACHN